MGGCLCVSWLYIIRYLFKFICCANALLSKYVGVKPYTEPVRDQPSKFVLDYVRLEIYQQTLEFFLPRKEAKS